ncbi:hypothetical protein EHQ27_02240 [Leptospira wolffii]|uniref:hypothetical protein n=1 Tax=Leptospira wolffii TaxID=409998 RepID=UPI001083B7F4|nr:hypothetical protein [Leptospira wolffii]TGK77247.1 hypothetical protein EHQ27_02240 [Leptospira wolffii]
MNVGNEYQMKWERQESGKISLRLLLLTCLVNCLIAPTNERTACIYDLKEKKGVQFIAIDLYQNDNMTPEQKEISILTANFHVIKCIEYHEKLKECKKEINYYLPALHPE